MNDIGFGTTVVCPVAISDISRLSSLLNSPSLVGYTVIISSPTFTDDQIYNNPEELFNELYWLLYTTFHNVSPKEICQMSP